MGKTVACQLAAKGANVVIVARTTSKLQSALETIKVSEIAVFVLELVMFTSLSGLCGAPLAPKIPLHQRRPDESRGLQAYH